MSDILIKGMEMPIFEHQSWDICKGADGKWYMVDNNAETSDGAWHEIVPVPPHGRLFDADSKTFPTPHRNPSNDYMKGWNACLRSVQQQPTVIPAEESE